MSNKPWLKKPGECVDRNGIPIYQGDLLRTPHFRGRRRKMYYLYHVAVWDEEAQGMRMVPTVRLDPQLRCDPNHRGGDPLLADDLAAQAEVIDGPAVDGEVRMYDERPRRPREPKWLEQ